MTRTFISLTLLFLCWVLLSGMFTPFLLTAGAGGAVAVLLIVRRMDIIGDGDRKAAQLQWSALLPYWFWLMKEIAVCAWDVTRLILHPKLPISPTLVEFSPTQKTDIGLVIHANSITLTPGTISVDVEPGRFLVHALTSEGASGLAGSEMNRRCSALEGQARD